MNLLELKSEINSKEKKLDYLDLVEGNNRIRAFTNAYEEYKTHFDKAKNMSYRCPENNCRFCIAKDRPKNKYIIFAIKRPGNAIQVWEIGDQILTAMKSIDSDIQSKDSADSISTYDLIVNKGQKNSNPLYTVAIKQGMKGTERFEQDEKLTRDCRIDLKDYIRKTEAEMESKEKKRSETETKYDPNIDYK